jgi:hypothetical protein
MPAEIRLLSTDFDGTLVSHYADPVLDPRCMQLIHELQQNGTIWAINTGRSRQLLESGLMDFDFPVHPDFILTSERDVFRRAENGDTGSRLAIGMRASHRSIGSSIPRRRRFTLRCSILCSETPARGSSTRRTGPRD